VESDKAGVLFVGVFSDGEQTQVLCDTGNGSHLHRLSEDKATMRVCVGSPGRRSSVWKCLRGKNSCDIYFGTRTSFSEFKFSFHESGIYRLARNTSARGDATFPVQSMVKGSTDPRLIDRWTRPEWSEAGTSELVSILIPHEDLIFYPNDGVRWDDVTWIPPAPHGWLSEIQYVRVQPNQGLIALMDLEADCNVGVADGLILPDGSVVVAHWRTSSISPDKQDELAELRTTARADVAPVWDLSPSSGPRAMYWQVSNTGTPVLWDLALTAFPF